MRNLKTWLIAAAIPLLAGCAAGGSSFVAPDAAPSDKGVVYFYRPAEFTGSAVDIMLVDNEAQIGRIQNGQFLKYLAAPGAHKFHTDTMAIDEAVEFEVRPGETHFVRTGLRQGMWASTWYLSRVFSEQALPEIKKCCKSGG